MELKQVEVVGIYLSSDRNYPVVLLREPGSDRFLPIWIGIFEANAIYLKMEGLSYPRPLTNDLLRMVIQGLKARVTKVVIDELRDSTYYAKVIIEKDNELLRIDARPSDSIALALGTDSPIFVSEDVLKTSVQLSPDLKDRPFKSNLAERVQKMDPGDLGRYKF